MAEKGKSKGQAGRTARRAEALRANLRRRKLQARRRDAASAKAATGSWQEPTGPDTNKR